jgi:polyphenol oxidase
MSATWIVPDWPAPRGVRALSTWRSGGVSSGVYASLNLGSRVGDEASAVAENRRLLMQGAGLPAEPCWLRQVHGTDVADLDTPPAAAPPDSPPEADAAITRHGGRVCAILTADCVPVLFASTDGRAVGAAHAGWRGLAAGVLRATVTALKSEPRVLMAWIGPCIGPEAYEVGPEVRDAMLAAMPGAAQAFRAAAGSRFMADLPQIARLQLQASGVARIFGGTECTYRDPDRYFSHRRDGQTGRQATLIWLD